LPDPIDFTVFEDAVWEWFKTSIEAEVVWAHQSAPRPDYPYGLLNIISGPIAVGPFEQKTRTDLTRPAGEEIIFEVNAPCTLVVSCQAHVNIPDSRNPTLYARTLVTRAQSRLYLPTVQETFKAANCSVQRVGSVTNISSIVNDGHVSRVGMDVTFNASLSIEEYTGYIKKAHVTSDLEPAVDPSLQIDQEFGDV
jgi:hypothetical protein